MTDPKLVKDLRDFENSLTREINRHSLERMCNVPDFILSRYLVSCLSTFCIAKNDNEAWHTKSDRT